MTYLYQWERDNVDIGGAVGSSYVLAPADVGHLISVRVDDQIGNVATSPQVGPVTASPPPPSGSSQGNGFLANLQGSSYATMSDAEKAKYGGIIVGFGDYGNVAAFAAAHPTVHGYGYQTSVESGGTTLWYGAISDAEARANGWVLKTAGGAEITNGQGLLMLDVGNAAYQTAWCNAVKARAASTGLHGKFLDNVDGQTFGFWFSAQPVKYPTMASWRAAYVSMLAAQQSQMPGIYRMGNVYDTDAELVNWMNMVLPYLDGAMVENYAATTVQNACLAAIVAAGKDPWVLVDPSQGQPGPDSPAGIALARSYHNATIGRTGGGFCFNGVNVYRSETTPGTWTYAVLHG